MKIHEKIVNPQNFLFLFYRRENTYNTSDT